MGAKSGSVTDTIAVTWADMRSRAARFDDWRRRLAHELSELPDTMQRLRNGATNFELVGERLAKSSESLEEIAAIYESTIAESGRRSARAVDALRMQVDALSDAAGSPERMAATVDDVQRAFDSIAGLNPFWPRRDEKP